MSQNCLWCLEQGTVAKGQRVSEQGTERHERMTAHVKICSRTGLPWSVGDMTDPVHPRWQEEQEWPREQGEQGQVAPEENVQGGAVRNRAPQALRSRADGMSINVHPEREFFQGIRSHACGSWQVQHLQGGPPNWGPRDELILQLKSLAACWQNTFLGGPQSVLSDSLPLIGWGPPRSWRTMCFTQSLRS